ncbi:hypothetical protein [Salinibacterium sp. ZJ450]|nr:hypothetical protein [Salinibacterium sp. ZJ450]
MTYVNSAEECEVELFEDTPEHAVVFAYAAMLSIDWRMIKTWKSMRRIG